MQPVKILSAIGAVVLSPVAWLMINTAPIRELRLKNLFGQNIQDFNLNGPLVLKQSLVQDIKSFIKSNIGGVRVIWGPPGSGKSTALRKVLKNMHDKKQIRGAVFIKPPPDASDIPTVWFSNDLSDGFGNTYNPNEKLSKFLPKFNGIPNVVVLDQLDNAQFGEEMRIFIKTLAEDSSLTKSYIAFAILSDAYKAKMMYDWNSHEKIVLLQGPYAPPTLYQWDTEDVEKWFSKDFLLHPSSSLLSAPMDQARIKEIAITAGTPGFLVDMMSFVRTDSEYHRYCDDWERGAAFRRQAWEDGCKMLSSPYNSYGGLDA